VDLFETNKIPVSYMYYKLNLIASSI